MHSLMRSILDWAISFLSESSQGTIRAIYFEGKTVKQHSEEEYVTVYAIYKRLARSYPVIKEIVLEELEGLDDETPVARRRRGWRFLLAEASELDELEWVAVDGELALARVLGEMVDVGQLMRSARLWLGTSNRSVAETIVHLFDELSTVS